MHRVASNTLLKLVSKMSPAHIQVKQIQLAKLTASNLIILRGKGAPLTKHKLPLMVHILVVCFFWSGEMLVVIRKECCYIYIIR